MTSRGCLIAVKACVSIWADTANCKVVYAVGRGRRKAWTFIAHHENLALNTTDGPFMYLLFNVTDGRLADPKVRAAVGYAIKREVVMAAAFFGRGSPLNAMPIPESSPYFNPEHTKHRGYDPEKAKAMLAEAG